MTLVRAGMVINEGAAHMEAIPLLLDDVEKHVVSADVPANLKQQYALLLVQLADSSSAAGKIRRCYKNHRKSRYLCQ